jgi:Glycosyltransferases involved in cell wall biogenesis
MKQNNKGITAFILAKNEEKNISECIESIQSFVDEIIVIDNDSKDRTKEIALEYGCIVKTIYEGSEAFLRNQYINLANYEWIFFIDADERATVKFGKDLKMFIKNLKPNVLALKVPINNYYGHGLWSTFQVFRLIRNECHILYEDGDIHPTIAHCIKQLNGEIEFVPSSMQHLDALIKKRSSSKRAQNMIKMIEVVNKKQGIEKYRLYNFLGVEYTAIKNYEIAEECYQKTIDNLPSYRNFARIYKIMNYMQQKKYEDALKEINILFELNPENFIGNYNYYDVKLKLKTYNPMEDDFLQRLCTILAEISLQKKKVDNAKYWVGLAIYIWPFCAQHYLNLASLTSDKEIFNILINKSVELNPFLCDERIYLEGDKPNIYEHQTSFLSSSKQIMNYNTFKEFNKS